MSQRKIKTLQELSLADDYLFSKVMEDPDICRLLLEKILNVTIRKVELDIPQKSIDPNYTSHGIRLDVYVADDQNTIYSVEMQRSNEYNIPKRLRYYQGMMDMDQLQKGSAYSSLKRDIIIFICTFDCFGEGRHRYTFESRCAENLQLCLGDETTKIILNTRGTMADLDQEILEFLSYVEQTDDHTAASATGELVRKIHRRVKKVKESKELEVEYMKLLENLKEQWEDGHTAGWDEKALEDASNLKKAGVDLSIIAKCTGLTLEAVEKL